MKDHLPNHVNESEPEDTMSQEPQQPEEERRSGNEHPGDLLERLERIESDTEKLEKPWYNQAATWMSIAALALSTFSVSYQWRRDRFDLERSKKEEFEKRIAALIDIHNQMQDLLSGPKTIETSRSLDALTSKKMIYLQSADDLLDDIEHRATISELFTIGAESVGVGRSEEGRRYMHMALDRAESPIDKMTVLSGLGGAYFFPDNNKNVEKGREFYNRALRVYKENPHDRPLLTEAASLLYGWALNEAASGSLGEANKLILQWEQLLANNPEAFSYIPSEIIRSQREFALARGLKIELVPSAAP